MDALARFVLGAIRLMLMLVLGFLGLLIALTIVVAGIMSFAVLWVVARVRGRSSPEMRWKSYAARYARWGRHPGTPPGGDAHSANPSASGGGRGPGGRKALDVSDAKVRDLP